MDTKTENQSPAGQSSALAVDAWLASVSRTICHAVEQRSDDVNVEMQARVISALKRTGAVDLRDSLREVVRIVEAMRMSTGLGKNQIERLERAKALLANKADMASGNQ